MITLIEEKGYQAVTVQNIVDRANLGRSTFYSHYQDKDELLVSGFERFFSHVSREMGKETGDVNPIPSLYLFRDAWRYPELYKALSNHKGTDLVLQKAYTILSVLVGERLKVEAEKEESSVPFYLIVHYAVSTLLSLLAWWVDNDYPCPPEEMETVYQELVLPGVCNGLRVHERRSEETAK